MEDDEEDEEDEEKDGYGQRGQTMDKGLGMDALLFSLSTERPLTWFTRSESTTELYRTSTK